MSDNPPPATPIVRRNQNRAPLTFAQESLWFLQQLDPESDAYNSTHLLRFTGGIDHECMERAINALIHRHEILRTTYPNLGGKPVQVAQSYTHFSLPYIQLSGSNATDRHNAAFRYSAEQGSLPFDLQRGPVFRAALLKLSNIEDIFFFCSHHIGSDAWSWQILSRELFMLYQAFRSGNSPELPGLPIQFTDYALWQHDWLCGETLTSYVDHWKKILSSDPPTLDLPLDKPRPTRQTFHGSRHQFNLPSDLGRTIKKICERERFTTFHFFFAVYAVLLMRYTRQEDIILGCPFANRQSLELSQVVGLFANILPIRIDLSGNPTICDLIAKVREKLLDAFTWQAIPFEVLVSEISPARDLSRTPIFQATINMRNIPKHPPVSIENVEVSEITQEDAPAPFDLSLEFNTSEEFFNASIRYNADLFSEDTITRMASHFLILADEMVLKWDRPISEVEMLSLQERGKILTNSSDVRSDLPQDCIHELISKQAHASPQVAAVYCNQKKLTYQSLEERANQLAAYMETKGVKKGSMVGIFLPRSEEMIISQLAILKCGASYVFYDRIYPVDRLTYILEDTHPVVVVTHSSMDTGFLSDYPKIFLDRNAEEINTFSKIQQFYTTDPDALIHVTYTSGSTGLPKGVLTSQKGALNYIHHIVKEFDLHEGERVLQLTSLAFDPSFRDTLGVLIFGGAIVLMDDEQMRDPASIIHAVIENRVDCIISIVPTMLRALGVAAKDRQLPVGRLRLLMPSGETLKPSDVALARDVFGQQVQIVNQYGPTECSMISTMYLVPEGSGRFEQEIPIGKPIKNVQFYILDPHLHLVPDGVTGELYVGGVGVSPGYLHHPELTRERFFPDPFGNGGMVYRSGDLVRRLPDGSLLFEGRVDQQMKIRGYRVELGEIEAAIIRYPNIRDAVVIQSRQDEQERLVAYITLSDPERYFSTQDLHQDLAKVLPFYMLPSSIFLLPELPLTVNGKINRQSLATLTSPHIDYQYVAPRNEIEKRLTSIWQDVIGVNRVGVRDNFFALGGHSLMAVLLFTRIQEEFKVSVPILLIFTDSTVEALATYISAQVDATGK